MGTQFNNLGTDTSLEANSLEFRLQHQNSQWVWCFSKQSVYSYNEHNVAKEIIGTFFDITDQKEQKNQIRALSQDFYTTFEQAAVGIAHVGLDGSWLKANKKICEILGYDLDELLRLNFQTITFPDDLNDDLELVATLMSGKQSIKTTQTIESTLQHPLHYLFNLSIKSRYRRRIPSRCELIYY